MCGVCVRHHCCRLRFALFCVVTFSVFASVRLYASSFSITSFSLLFLKILAESAAAAAAVQQQRKERRAALYGADMDEILGIGAAPPGGKRKQKVSKDAGDCFIFLLLHSYGAEKYVNFPFIKKCKNCSFWFAVFLKK